jgi:hypothetical protein
MNRVALDEGPGAEDVVDIASVSSGDEAAIGAGVFLRGGNIGVTLCWAGWGLRLDFLASDVVKASVVTGGRYMSSKGVLIASSSSSSSESDERPPSSWY